MEAATKTSKQEPWPFLQLPKVVVAHATFQKAIAGDPSESSLSYPIQALLGVKGSWRVVAEEDHPALREGARLGRPWQIDFMGKSKGRKDEAWSFALEIKIHGGKAPDRLIRDVVKLLLLGDSKESENALRYLLVLFPRLWKGSPDLTEPKVAQNLYGRSGKPIDLFDHLLPWKNSPRSFFIGDLSDSVRRDVDKALKQFGRQTVRGDVIVDLVAKDWSDDFACGLWQFRWKSPAKRYGLAAAGDAR
ncbi:hypothetical protein [Bradyrhizobium ottawaense]|uniref:hypothetical protein n=1 Tax=Bradyrhizobium ottawaense TaxID=931866 RepID=UPI003395AD70